MSYKALFGLTFIAAVAGYSAAEPSKLTAPEGPLRVVSGANEIEVADSASRQRFRFETSLLRRMQRPVDWKLEGETVEALAERVRRELKVPVIIEWPDLEDVGVGRDDTVKEEFRDLPFETALERALDRLYLVWTLSRDSIVITTNEGLDLETRVYPVGDLLDRGRFQPVAIDTLADAIVSTIAADTWAENGGGEAEIRPFDTGDAGMLIISQTFAVHRQIAQLLEDLRSTRDSKESRLTPVLSFDEFRERLLPLKAIQPAEDGVVRETDEVDRAKLNQLASTEGMRQAARRSNDFSLDLLRHATTDDGENSVLCGYSVREAMTLIALGAAGETRNELIKALRLPENVALAAAESLAMRLHLSSTERSKGQFSSANSLWVQTPLAVDADFAVLAERAMDAAVNSIDFRSADQAAKEINDWVARGTGGKIRNAITRSEVRPGTTAAIFNATYFNDAWETPFKPKATSPGDFKLPNGVAKKVAMMHGKISARAATLDEIGMQVAELPYRGERLSAVILLPESGENGLADVAETLTAESLEIWLDSLGWVDLTLTMPKFKMASRHELRPTLEKMGLAKVFDATSSELREIVDAPWAVEQIFQSAVIEVDERGTEAAAATGGMGGGIMSTPLQTMVVDRPFLFLVRDVRSGCVLFIARAANPAE